MRLVYRFKYGLYTSAQIYTSSKIIYFVYFTEYCTQLVQNQGLDNLG